VGQWWTAGDCWKMKGTYDPNDWLSSLRLRSLPYGNITFPSNVTVLDA
jgi:hypothetical protein